MSCKELQNNCLCLQIYPVYLDGMYVFGLELVSKELNHLAAILHVYAGGLNFIIIFQKENGNTFTLLIIFIVKSLQKEQNSTNLLL